MDKTYHHPKDLDTVTIECFISFLRDKRKRGKVTGTEFVLEGNLRDYLNERNKTNEPFLTEEELEDKFGRVQLSPDTVSTSEYPGLKREEEYKWKIMDYEAIEFLPDIVNGKKENVTKCTFCDDPLPSLREVVEGQVIVCNDCLGHMKMQTKKELDTVIELPYYTAMIIKSENKQFDDSEIEKMFATAIVKDVIFNLKKQKLI